MIRIREKTSREEWLQWRLSNINASEAGALVGVHKYITPLQLYHEKKTGLGKTQTRVMSRGLHMEAAILSMVREERPDWTIQECKDYYDEPELRIGCSPDAFAWSPAWSGHANVQLKAIGRPAFENDWRNDDGDVVVPLYYQIQTVVEAILTGSAQNFIVPYVIEAFPRDEKQDLFILEVPIHEGAWGRIVNEAKKFWENFEADIEPALDPEHDGDFIKRLHPTADGRIIDLRGDNELPGLLENYKLLSAELSELNKPVSVKEKLRKTFAVQIQAKLGSALGGVLPGWQIEWKDVNRKASAFRQLSIKQVGV
jgi:predicted phage-related endonuclease